jgi:enoyl-CoA hydratase/carnithine racemase
MGLLKTPLIRISTRLVRPYASRAAVDLERLGGGSVTLHLPSSKQSPPGIAYLIFRNPERRNAISGKMMIDLQNAVAELGRVADRMDRRDAGIASTDGKGFGDQPDEVVSCVIMAGSSGMWCAGFDLSSDREAILTRE